MKRPRASCAFEVDGPGPDVLVELPEHIQWPIIPRNDGGHWFGMTANEAIQFSREVAKSARTAIERRAGKQLSLDLGVEPYG